MVLASQGAMAAPYPAADGVLPPYGTTVVGPMTQVTGDCAGQEGPTGLVSGIIKGVGNLIGDYGNNCGIPTVIPGVGGGLVPGVGGGLVPGVLGGGVPYNGGGGLI